MHRHSLPEKLVAAALVLALSGYAGWAWAGTGSATLTGRVLASGSGAPLGGWTVLVGNPQTRTVQTTTRTNEKGEFSVAELPAASYEVAVQDGSKLYPANGTVRLAPGQTRDIQLAVNQQAAPPPGPTDDDSDRGGPSWYNNPVVATLLVIGGAVLIGIAVDNASDDENQSASPSTP